MAAETAIIWNCAAVAAPVATTVLARDDLKLQPPSTLAPAVGTAGGAGADEGKAGAAELAQKPSNPVANRITVPVQFNWDFGIGPAETMRFTANVQPVSPSR